MAKQKAPDPKLVALRERGAVNPRPKAVTDELFRTHEFFDPRDLVQVKCEMLRRVRWEGMSVARAAADFGFSRLSFYQTRAAFEGDGLSGLIPKKRGPHGPHKLTNEVMNHLRKVHDDAPSLRAPQLAEMIDKKFGIHIHPRTIERALGRGEKKRKPRWRPTGP